MSKTIIILFINLRMDSSANILLTSKEKMDYKDNELL